MGVPIFTGTPQFRPPSGQIAVYTAYDFDPARDVTDGKLSPVWYADHIKEYLLPAPFTFIGQPVKTITLHEAARDPFLWWLDQVHKAKLWHVIRVTGGDFAWRLQRQGVKLSMHALAGALDTDPKRNALGVDPEKTYIGRTAEGHEVVRLAEVAGLTWGGRWDRPDAMHWQFARKY